MKSKFLREMSFVQQQTSTDCGIAAVAMIARVPYDVAKGMFGEFSRRGFRTTERQVRGAIKRLGLRAKRKSKSVTFRGLEKLESDALVLVRIGRRDDNQNLHWIVWNAELGSVLDPGVRKPRRNYDCVRAIRLKRKALRRRGAN
jgi:ABC-type bacteriocin/lantibiotic exporter with double-glycine peptidase domain